MLIETPIRPSPLDGRSSGNAEPFPADVEMILSAMEAGNHAWNHQFDGPSAQRSGTEANEDRRGARFSYRVRAQLRLFRDPPDRQRGCCLCAMPTRAELALFRPIDCLWDMADSWNWWHRPGNH